MTHFPIRDAVICIECRHVFEVGPDCCPHCPESTFIYLNSFVKLDELQAEIDIVRFIQQQET